MTVNEKCLPVFEGKASIMYPIKHIYACTLLQSARTRPEEVSGQADVSDDSNYADHRNADNSRTRPQNTSGSAHAVMSRRSSAHATMPMSMMTEVSRRDDSSATPGSAYEMRSRYISIQVSGRPTADCKILIWVI